MQLVTRGKDTPFPGISRLFLLINKVEIGNVGPHNIPGNCDALLIGNGGQGQISIAVLQELFQQQRPRLGSDWRAL